MAKGAKQKDEIEAMPHDPVAPTQLPSTGIAFGAKAKDLDALRNAVVDAAGVGAGLWFSYLFVLLYLLIAVGGVTHRDLFFESPVKLPFLNVDLPLVGFFVLGPALFLVVHAYVLMHLVLLAGKVGVFDAELRKQVADDDLRTRLRRQLPSNIFVQILAGPREVRTGVFGFMLRLIAQISLVAGPIALLVFFQLQFLPYHHEAITWWHRIAVVADLILLWILWPSVARGETTRWRDMPRHVHPGKIVAITLATFAPILLLFTIATFPGEWLNNNLPSMRLIPLKDGTDKDSSWSRISLHELVVAGEVDLAARKPTSLWSNRLVLPGLDVIDRVKFDSEAKSAALPESVSLRARHLEGAVLIGANLRKADFTAARLQGAALERADLRGATFECYRADRCPQLQGASLKGAQLQGTSLRFARLQGASLESAQLQGASLEDAELQGASLEDAQLQGASLEGAQLQGASLEGAQLQGASLRFARLQGASLEGAQLQGVSLEDAELQLASLRHVFVWRSDIRAATATDAQIIEPVTGPKQECFRRDSDQLCDWSAASFERLRQLIIDELPQGNYQRAALARIDERLDPTKDFKEEENIGKAWADLASRQLGQAVYEKLVADQWRKLGCAAEGAPYVVEGLLNNMTRDVLANVITGFLAEHGSSRGKREAKNQILRGSSPFGLETEEKRALMAIFLDDEHCAGSRGLSRRWGGQKG
jgi:uncharacterized protein YjbI with pentapeptide repeats